MNATNGKPMNSSPVGEEMRKESQMSYPDPHYLGDEGEISTRYRPADQKPELTIGSVRRPRSY
jgi:hypothetical protein